MTIVARIIVTLGVVGAPSYCESRPPEPTVPVHGHYELREYHVAAGRAEELHARFREHTVRLDVYKRQG